MKKEIARSHVLAAVQTAIGTLHDPRFVSLIDNPDQDALFSELEFDSLAAMEFCLAIEERTGVQIEPADLVLHPSINSLTERLSRPASS